MATTGREASAEAWERFKANLAAVGAPPPTSSALVEAFFTGYKEGMSFGMEEGRKLCVKLMNINSSAPAAESSNS